MADGRGTDVAEPRADRLRAASNVDVTPMPLESSLTPILDEAEARPQLVESIVRSLRELREVFGEEVVAVEVEAELAAFATARVTEFVPILVERRVRARLRRPLSK